MKILGTAVLLVATYAAAVGQTRIDARMEVDSVMREFIVSVPSGNPPAGGYPLVFMFHGTSQDGEKFYQDSQWKEKGEVEKIITVFPTALRYCVVEDGQQRTTTKWHNGEAEEISCPGQYMRNDVNFVHAMLDSITIRYSIDRRRIYASGFSNGMGFASKLAVEMSDVFAAVAGVGAALSESDSTDPKRNIPIWLVLGTLDDKWLKGYEQLGISEFPFNDTTLAYLSRPIHRYLGAFNLTDAYTKTEVGRTISYRFDTPASGEETSEFRFTLINNMFHVYPDGNNIPIVAADIFWEFFSRFTTPVSAEAVPAASADVVLYPNPARNYLVVTSGGGRADAMTIVLRTVLGQEVYRAHSSMGTALHLPRLRSGVYIAEIVSGKDVTMQPLIVR